MTIHSIRHQLAAAADDATAPPVPVSSVEVYRAGLRRRRTRRWLAAGVVALAVTGLSAGVAIAVQPHEPARLEIADGGPPPPDPGADRTCQELADEVSAVLRPALPADVTWRKPRVPEGAEDQSCGGGGLFWVSFTRNGKLRELGFEGGALGDPEPGCSAERKPVRCEQIPGGEIGHLNRAGEYGVLLSNGKVGFFLGITEPGTPQPLTLDQLALAAREIAAEVEF